MAQKERTECAYEDCRAHTKHRIEVEHEPELEYMTAVVGPARLMSGCTKMARCTCEQCGGEWNRIVA